MIMRRLTVEIERWPIAGTFTISRGSRTEAVVVVATISENGTVGRGECVPYARYGETPEGVRDLILAQSERVAMGCTRTELLSHVKAGAARNALDCALWDFEAKRTGASVAEIAEIAVPQPVTTAYTISLGPPESMAAAAGKAAHRPLLKVKLGGDGDPERIAAVREAAPDSRLIVDANEAWLPGNFERNLAACRAAGVRLVEQPFPATNDAALEHFRSDIPICADESMHDRAGLADVARRYQAINIKLDKTGGLTEALLLAEEAKALGLSIMVGCMVGTSLAMAPAMMLTTYADFVDLDGPLLLARDREPGLRFDGSVVHPPERALWG